MRLRLNRLGRNESPGRKLDSHAPAATAGEPGEICRSGGFRIGGAAIFCRGNAQPPFESMTLELRP